MIRKFEKYGKIRSYEVANGIVKAMVKIGNHWVANVPLADFLADGWVEILPVPGSKLPSVEELVEKKVRERYSINQEFEVNRKRETEVEEFNAYYNYVEECIAWAHQQPNRDDANNEECVTRE